jgi:2-keto-4-pentenoate hydratase
LSTIDRLADALAAAHRSGTLLALDAELDALPIEDGPAVQMAVMQRLGETAPASKVAINPEGHPVMAPMFGSRVVKSGATLPRGDAIGIEVEIALRLGADITPGMDVRTAIDAYFVGIELIGTRLQNRREAGLGALLGDNLINSAYVVGAEWPHGSNIEFPVVITIDGQTAYDAPAVNPFGTVFAALEAYAREPFDRHGALKAGHLITTGTLCGMVPIPGPCSISARLGDSAPVTLTLT